MRTPPLGATMRNITLVILATLAACGDQSGVRQQGAADQVFTPAQYTVEDFYKNTEFFGGSWSPDRRKILVSSNSSGIYNAYAIPAAGGAPEQLTRSTTDAIVALSYFPRDERFIYSSDKGGDELTHIYVRNTDGSVKDITPGTKLKANFAGWAGNDRSFFISTNQRDQRYFDLYEVPIATLRPTLFYRNTEGFDLGPVSRDKRSVALGKPRTTNDADVYLHDKRAGT